MAGWGSSGLISNQPDMISLPNPEGFSSDIARQIVVEKYAGAIAINPTSRKGTEFVITLPVKTNH
nr:hypothetical protein [Nostoc sp. NOS(2021)]